MGLGPYKSHYSGISLPRPNFTMSLKNLEARVGIEPTHKGFADLSLTTWVPRLIGPFYTSPADCI